MGGFSGTILTNAGRALQAKAQIGTQLVFTKVKLGSGQLANGQTLESLTDLITPVMDISIQDLELIGDGTTRIRAVISNESLAQGFYVREVGLYANDPTSGEILYSVSNAGAYADYLPAGGGAVIVEQVLDIITVVGNASNIVANINDYLVIATKDDVNKQKIRIDALETQRMPFGRNSVITGPLSLRGAAMALRDRYSENLCVGGTAISGGDDPARPKELAFDSTAFYASPKGYAGWVSPRINASVMGAWLGYKFPAPKIVNLIRLFQGNTPISVVSSVKVQASNDGNAWVDISAHTVIWGETTVENRLVISNNTPYQYWRVMANSDTVSPTGIRYWSISFLSMYELLNSELTDSDIILQASTLLSFAAGFNDKGPLDYIYQVPADIKLSLAAADGYTVPLQYTDDLCNGGTAISSGDTGAYVKDSAFVNDGFATYWMSSQTGAAVNGAAYIGYDFGVAKNIRKIRLSQTDNSVGAVSSVKVQYSADGTTWTTATTIAVKLGINNIPLPSVGAFRYWRLLANSVIISGTAGGWSVFEIEMYEAIQTYYIYTDRAADGNVTLGAAKQKPRIQTAQSDYYTDNLCVGGAAISGGDNSGTPKENAFDEDTTKGWGSVQTTSAISGNAYIGYDFGISRHIRRVNITQSTIGAQGISSIKIQRSSDGVTWYDVATYVAVSGTNRLELPATTAARYWRVLANANPTGGNGHWDVLEITMHELATDLLWYNPQTGVTQLANNGAWTTVQRIPVGEAVVNSAGQVVSYKTYPYGLATLLVPPATEENMPVNLGQFEYGNNWIKMPNGKLIQFGTVSLISGGSIVFPREFKQAVKTVLAVPAEGAVFTTSGFCQVGANTLSSVVVFHGGGTTAWSIGYIAIGE